MGAWLGQGFFVLLQMPAEATSSGVEAWLGPAFFILMFVGVPLLLVVGGVAAYLRNKKQDEMFDDLDSLDDEELDKMAEKNEKKKKKKETAEDAAE